MKGVFAITTVALVCTTLILACNSQFDNKRIIHKTTRVTATPSPAFTPIPAVIRVTATPRPKATPKRFRSGPSAPVGFREATEKLTRHEFTFEEHIEDADWKWVLAFAPDNLVEIELHNFKDDNDDNIREASIRLQPFSDEHQLIQQLAYLAMFNTLFMPGSHETTLAWIVDTLETMAITGEDYESKDFNVDQKTEALISIDVLRSSVTIVLITFHYMEKSYDNPFEFLEEDSKDRE